MNLHIPAFLLKPKAEPLPYQVREPHRDRKGRYKPGNSPALNRLRTSVRLQLAVYVATTSVETRRAETMAKLGAV